MTEDDLRAMFARRAAAVAPPEDLLGGVHDRVRGIRRRRGRAAAAVAVACAVVAAPALLPRTTAPDPAETDRAVADTGGPANRLPWPARGRPLPRAFAAAVRTWLARDATRHHAAPGRVRRHDLWSGALPDGRWSVLTQVWNPADARRADAWSTLLFTGARDGRRLNVPYDLPTRFTHAGHGRAAAGAALISGYGFDLGDAIVVVGAPGAARAALGEGRRSVTKPLTDGAAIFATPPHAPAYRLFRLSAANGAPLTPDDRHTGTGHGWHLDLTRQERRSRPETT